MKTLHHSILSVRSDEELYIDVQILIIFWRSSSLSISINGEAAHMHVAGVEKLLGVDQSDGTARQATVNGFSVQELLTRAILR